MGDRVVVKTNYAVMVLGPRECQPRLYTFPYQIDLARRIQNHRDGLYGKDEIKGVFEIDWNVPVGKTLLQGTVLSIRALDWAKIRTSDAAVAA